ncbi:MAG: Ig-like domain-containing protein [Chloroflexota bacterium]
MRRLISLVSIGVALVALGLVLYNATLVDRKPPAIVEVSLSAPAGDERVAQTVTAIDIEFSEPVRTATVEARFRIEPYVAGAFAWDGSTAIFTPSAKLPGDTEFTVQVAAGFEDLLGNVAEIGLEAWTFRTVGPPVVVRATPASGATGVAVDGVVELEFDRLMDTASVEAAIRIDPAAAIHASWTGETVTLVFDTQLRFGTAYTVTVGPEAADTGGNRLREPFTLLFKTVAAGLSAIDTVPAAGASGVEIRTSIAIRFNAPIDPDTGRTAFRITPSVDGDIRIVSLPDDLAPADGVPPAAEADTILFVPDDPLAPHTTYSITLEPIVARRDDPEAVAAGRAWSFTTGSPTGSGQNLVAFLSARSGVRNVWLMNPDGTNPHQLTTELVPVSGFDATGDGSRIAYSAGGIVNVVDSSGDNLVRLTAADRFEYAPVFTPDDRHLIVGRRGADGADLGFWLVPIPGVGGDERQLVDHGAPTLGSAGLRGEGIGGTDGLPGWMPRSAVDPTGRFVIIVTAEGEVLTLEIGSEPFLGVALRVPIVGEASASWSPRHEAFVLSARPAGDGSAASRRPSLWLIAPDGTARMLEGTDGAVGPIAVGPDGSIAMILRGPGDEGAGIAILPLASTTLSRFSPAAGFDDRWPTFSPDGGTLLIGRTLRAQPEAGNGIWAFDLESAIARQLATDGAYARWLP